MPVSDAVLQQKLKKFALKDLLIDLGWDRYPADPLPILLDGHTYTLQPIAQKRGVGVFLCGPGADGGIPDHATRRKLDKQVARSVREHLIVYTDAAQTWQRWQWVGREPGRREVSRELAFHKSQPGDLLIQKLRQMAFRLDEEERLTHVEVTGRVRQALDVDKITKRFYDRFKHEHAAFLGFIKGIQAQGDREWYASLMLNRLMFIYFIQYKRFLDDDPDYLRNRLKRMQERKGKDRFHSFYRFFLRRLFHEGLGQQENDRDPELKALLGKVPYLNGGLFEVHQLENDNKQLDIPDEAFERIFDFFENYDWHLEARPPEYYQLHPGAKEEINPDVLGYIFEKYINQKQMGAYYTKEDITEYISKSTILPFLFNAAEKKCAIAFRPDGAVWRLLRDDPDRYIYEAVRKGVDLPLPPAVAAGLDDVSKRDGWNRPATLEYALPTETWREYIARRQRCHELRAKLKAGEVYTINDLVTYNLDIRRFAEDVIEGCEGPELLRALYHAVEKVSVLDPACGSGAFLFAALNLLEPLYDACLERMHAFLSDLEASNKPRHPEKFSDFRKVLERAGEGGNQRYFILKAIVINNLYGVDLMREAVEICKLRLFLKLVAQVERVTQLDPLPDIDFNIRAGNTLVGFASLDDVQKTLEGNLGFGKQQVQRIVEDAESVDRAFMMFRHMQTEQGMYARQFSTSKRDLRQRLDKLRDELDRYLASEYDVDPDKPKDFEEWRESHRPFHWFAEFYGTMSQGGFDAIIANPPYVELSEVSGQYSLRCFQLLKTGNLFSLFAERFAVLARVGGRVGAILPLSAICTPRMLPLMKLVTQEFSPLHVSNFAVRPGKLFVGVDMNLSILVGQKRRLPHCEGEQVFVTGYQRWRGDFRPFLFSNLRYNPTQLVTHACSIPKLGTALEKQLLDRVLNLGGLGKFQSNGFNSESVYYHSGGRYFRKCLRERLSNEYKELSVPKGAGDAVICLLSSSFYYWFWISISDCYHVTKRDIEAAPIRGALLHDSQAKNLAGDLLKDLWKNAERRHRTRADASQREEVNFDVAKSRPFIDRIDGMLAKHLNLSAEELDFLLNYDAKFRSEDSD